MSRYPFESTAPVYPKSFIPLRIPIKLCEKIGRVGYSINQDGSYESGGDIFEYMMYDLHTYKYCKVSFSETIIANLESCGIDIEKICLVNGKYAYNGDIILKQNSYIPNNLYMFGIINGSLTIEDSALYADFKNLRVIEQISLINCNIFNLKCFENLTIVKNSIILNNCTNLKTLQGLENLESLGSLSINNCPNLQSFDGLNPKINIMFDILSDNEYLVFAEWKSVELDKLQKFNERLENLKTFRNNYNLDLSDSEIKEIVFEVMAVGGIV